MIVNRHISRSLPNRASRSLASLFLLLLPLFLDACSHAYINPASLRQPGAKRVRCHAARTIRRLKRKPQEGLDPIDVATSVLTTPFKKLGVSGWKDTGCDATVVGVPVREAQASSGGHYTIDLRLLKLEINGKEAKPGRYLRIEILAGTKAQEVASKTRITTGSKVSVGGPVVVDSDGPFLEIHPGADFHVVNGTGNGNGVSTAPK